MNSNRTLHKYAAIVVLVCFFTALTGLPAFAGHDCCGNCGDSRTSHTQHAGNAMVIGSDPVAAPDGPDCACALQPGNDRDSQVYSLAKINTAGDTQPARTMDTAATKDSDHVNRQARARTIHTQIRARSGPLYLTHQVFLC